MQPQEPVSHSALFQQQAQPFPIATLPSTHALIPLAHGLLQLPSRTHSLTTPHHVQRCAEQQAHPFPIATLPPTHTLTPTTTSIMHPLPHDPSPCAALC